MITVSIFAAGAGGAATYHRLVRDDQHSQLPEVAEDTAKHTGFAGRTAGGWVF